MKRVCVALICFLCASCAAVGPASVPRDHFDYNAAIAQTAQDQLLMNLVRLRYSETPSFLKVNSVISQYLQSVTGSVLVNANNGIDSGNIGAGGNWAHAPVITYAPLSGQEFSKNLLTPLPPSATFGLMQSGWAPELVFRLTTSSINNVNNEVAMPPRQRQADDTFIELVTLWSRLRDPGVIGLRNPGLDQGGANVVAFFATGADAEPYRDDIQRLKTLLRIDPAAERFRLVYGLVPESEDDVAVLTGSIWEIMQNLAWQIDVPPEHVAEGRTLDSFRSRVADGQPVMQVLYATERPENAFAAVQAHDHWFYIDQGDRDSKRVFSFLQLLLTLTETSQPAAGPLISISP